jgi:hypothetical protein
MVRPLRGYEGPQAGVSVPGFPNMEDGSNFSRLGAAFFQNAERFARENEKVAVGAAREAGINAGLAGPYELQDPNTAAGAAFNDMARDRSKSLPGNMRLTR